jgi:hypothetical protein
MLVGVAVDPAATVDVGRLPVPLMTLGLMRDPADTAGAGRVPVPLMTPGCGLATESPVHAASGDAQV